MAGKWGILEVQVVRTSVREGDWREEALKMLEAMRGLGVTTAGLDLSDKEVPQHRTGALEVGEGVEDITEEAPAMAKEVVGRAVPRFATSRHRLDVRFWNHRIVETDTL